MPADLSHRGHADIVEAGVSKDYQRICFTGIKGSDISLNVSVTANIEIDDNGEHLNNPITIYVSPAGKIEEPFETIVDLTIPQTKALCAALNAMLEFLAARGQS